MKKKLTLLLPVILLFSHSHSQTLDFYGLHSWARNIPASDHGFGGGMSFMGSPLRLSNKRGPVWVNGQFGGGMFASSLGRRTLKDVPLLNPPEGNAKVRVKNSFVGINLTGRFTFPDRRSNWVPYVDASVYYRGILGRALITPNVHKKGYEYSSDSTIAEVESCAWGFSGGVLKALGTDGGYLDIGFIWTSSAVPGSFIDLSSVQKEADGISMHLTHAPVDLFMLKVGFVILIEDGNFRHHYMPPSGGSSSSSSCHHSGHWNFGGGHSNSINIHFK